MLRQTSRLRWIGVLGALVIVAGCSTPTAQETPAAASAGATSPTDTAAASVVPTLTPTATSAPATQAPTPTGTVIKNGFRFDDVLKVQQNGLAVRVAPTRTARLVHQYLILGTTAGDLGEVRLNKGDEVKVQMGPLLVGTTTWYLVWPAQGGSLNDQTTNWYDAKPLAGQPVPAWIATSVSGNAYATLSRRPSAAEIAAVEVAGLVAAGRGNYVSPPMPRHDAFQLYWAASAAGSNASCTFALTLVPDDADFVPLDVLDTSTPSVKVAPLDGAAVAWPDAGASTWATFTLEIATSCQWAIRLIRLEHD